MSKTVNCVGDGGPADISETWEATEPVLVACEAAFGRLGHALSPKELARVRRVGSGAVWGTRLSHRRQHADS